ncbi:MAG: hypothetical protein EZS28_003740 [Streblomastix strix]|uniref:Uncharacterized protein n=1 Tax=Streblomastix strix TaxID=222440 RepID=A0A5J4X0C0_9EUKA|nr:MAG: hypothetical protein EZS28_003740 [Streblomastix strix]
MKNLLQGKLDVILLEPVRLNRQDFQPIGEPSHRVPTGDQTLQLQVKNNEDIIYGSSEGSNDAFEPPVLNAITKFDLSSQLERQSFLASNGSDPTLIVYGDRITLTASYATTCLFPGGVIMDTWNQNGKGQFEAQSYVYEIVKKLTNLIEAGVQGLNRTNYLNSEIKLMDELAIRNADRAAYFIKDGPFITYSSEAKLAQLDVNLDTICVFNLCFESKGLQGMTQEVGRIPDSALPADQPQLSFPEYSADIYKYCASIFSKIQQLVLNVGKGLQGVKDNVYKQFIKPFAKPILATFGPVGQTIACGTYISMREMEELIGNQTAVPYTIPIRFRVSIPFDDLLIFSAFTDYPNGLFGDLKIKFKINPHAFVFCQVNPIISMAKYYAMNKDKLLGSSQQKLMDIDLMFRNWSLTFQYTKQFTQLDSLDRKRKHEDQF